MQSTQWHFFCPLVTLETGEDDCNGGGIADGVGDGGDGDDGDGDGGDGGHGDGGDGDGGSGEATRLISSEEFSPVSPSIPRKISGAASSSLAAHEGGDAAGTAVTTLFLASTAARWLTLDAAKAAFATFLG